MFKAFPEFTQLTLSDREEYERFVRKAPPISDLAFVSLMTIWSILDNARVSTLNDNLVISYWIPGDDLHSGLSLVGTNKVDESLCTIFDHLKENDQPARLVNVPQFVVDNIRYPEIFDFNIKTGDEDYIVSFKHHSSLEAMPFFRRARIRKFVSHTGRLEIRQLDLRQASCRKLLLDRTSCWPERGLNDIGKFEQEALVICVENAPALGVECLCLFESGKLVAYNLYYTFPESKYLLIAHTRLDYSLPGIFDYMAYSFAQWWLERGIEFGNIHNDMGIVKLRILQIALRPVELFRKYTVRPAGRRQIPNSADKLDFFKSK